MIGAKIVCKYDYNNDLPLHIKKNGVYTIIADDEIGYSIINDLGERKFFSKSRFVSLKDDRKKKLSKIWYKKHQVNL